LQILIIDDDKTIRELTSILLSTFSSEVTVFQEENSADGIARLKENYHYLDVIICDFNMPGGNGDLVYEVWRKLCPHIPFIFFTAEAEAAKNSLRNNKFLESTLSFFEKGGDIDDLESKIQECMHNGYKPISVASVLPDVLILCDLYLFIGERRFLKVINSGDKISREKLDSFQSKGEVNFYLRGETILDRKWIYPSFPIQDIENLSISELMECFRRTFSERLGDKFNQVRFNSVCLRLERNLNASNDKVLGEVLIKIKGRDNYVFDHSLLLCILSIMALEELGLSNPRNREIIVRSALFHNLFLDDGTAFSIDILPERFWKQNSPEKWSKNEKKSLLIKMKEWKFSGDEELVIESLINKMSDPEWEMKKPHRLGAICLKVHEFINELYARDFRNIEEALEEKFKDDEEVTVLFDSPSL